MSTNPPTPPAPAAKKPRPTVVPKPVSGTENTPSSNPQMRRPAPVWPPKKV